MNGELINSNMNTHNEKRVREMLPAGFEPNDYHRVVTVALLLPADAEKRNAILSKMSPLESIGEMQIIDIRQGFAGIELDAARQFIDKPEGFEEQCAKLSLRHNQMLAVALNQDEDCRVKQASSATPILTPWKHLMGSLCETVLGVAVAFAAITFIQKFFE